MCNLHSFNRKNFVTQGFKSPKNLFCQRSENKKSPVDDLSRTRNHSQAFSSKYPNSANKILQGCRTPISV